MAYRVAKITTPHLRQFIATALGMILLIVGITSAARVTTAAHSFAAVVDRDRPLLELNLRHYGYKPRSAGRRDFLSLGFVDAHHVLFGWTTFDRSHDEKTGPLTPAPSHLHALIFDTNTGEIETSHEWPTSSFLATISSVDEDKLLICTGDTIQLLSRRLNLIRELKLSRFSPCSADNLSPSRESFSIDSGKHHEVQRSVLDVDTFRTIATWSNEAANIHFTDTMLAGNCKPDFEACVREFAGRWHPLALPTVEAHPNVSWNPNLGFINGSTMAFRTGNAMIGVTLEGSLAFRMELPQRHYVGAIATSVEGDRFAFLDIQMHGSEALDMQFPSDNRVAVYSLRRKTVIYTRKVKGIMWTWLPLVERRCTFALSPDGSLLAIVDDGMLAVYQLPERKS